MELGLDLLAMPARASRACTALHQAYLAEAGGLADPNVCGAPDQCPDHCKVYAVQRLPSCSHKWSKCCLRKHTYKLSEVRVRISSSKILLCIVHMYKRCLAKQCSVTLVRLPLVASCLYHAANTGLSRCSTL